MPRRPRSYSSSDAAEQLGVVALNTLRQILLPPRREFGNGGKVGLGPAHKTWRSALDRRGCLVVLLDGAIYSSM